MMKRHLINLFFLLALFPASPASAQDNIFNNTYGTSLYNYGKRLIQLSDGSFIMAANSTISGGNTGILLIHTDTAGIIIREVTIQDYAVLWINDMIKTTGGDFIITGTTDRVPGNGYDVLLLRLDPALNVIWMKQYGGHDWDIGNAVAECDDGGLLVAGLTYSYGAGNEDFYLVRTDAQGDTLWTKTFGGPGSDVAASVCRQFSGNWLVAGSTNSFGAGDYDAWLLEMLPSGDTLQSETFGMDKEDMLNCLRVTPDSGFVFVGSTRSYGAVNRERWLMKGNRDWSISWMMPKPWEIDSGDDVSNYVCIDKDSNYLIVGFTTSYGNGARELFLTRMADNNVFLCSLTEGSEKDDQGEAVVQCADGGYGVIGSSEGYGEGISNIYFVKSGENCQISSSHVHVLGLDTLEHHAAETVSVVAGNAPGIYRIVGLGSGNKILTVFDLGGRLLFSAEMVINNGECVADISGFGRGIYLLRLISGDGSFNFKVVR